MSCYRCEGVTRYLCRVEITPPGRLIYTFEFEGMPGHALLNPETFEEHDVKKKLTLTSVFQTVEDCDGMLASGMEEGSTDSMDRLAELLANAIKV
jgi:uncharacterized protein YndB with AHSA1/START domain